MATCSIHQQEGITPSDEYFDIMLVGKTGLGKTTTADKILLANPTSKIYSYNPPQPDESHGVDQENEAPVVDQENEAPVVDQENGAPVQHHEDLSMWHISDDAEDHELVQKRLKDLIFCRSVENPHEEVNRMREESDVTKQCELLSNETSKVRVLDVPGFFGSEIDIPNTDVLSRAEAVTSRNLQIMRKILHIKEAFNFKFHRIVYFLPEQGVLKRHSQILQMDIETMETYFGSSIFYCMVVAATHSTSAYQHFPEGKELYSQQNYKKTKDHFQLAMRKVLGESSDMPNPPIVFVSYRETCDGMLDLIREANVAKEGVELSFNSKKCTRCDITIKKVKGKFKGENENKLKLGKDVPISTKAVYMCTNEEWRNEIPYNETTCHPMIVPKYTKLERIAGGIAHLITLYLFEGEWPSFKSFEEVCIACRSSPGTRGCKKIGAIHFLHKKCSACKNCRECEKYSEQCKVSEEWTECSNCKICETCEECKKSEGYITVDHSNSVLENNTIQEETKPHKD